MCSSSGGPTLQMVADFSRWSSRPAAARLGTQSVIVSGGYVLVAFFLKIQAAVCWAN